MPSKGFGRDNSPLLDARAGLGYSSLFGQCGCSETTNQVQFPREGSMAGPMQRRLEAALTRFAAVHSPQPMAFGEARATATSLRA